MKRVVYLPCVMLPVLIWSGAAMAAVCTSLSAGRWDQAVRWSCGHVPLAADTVVIAHNNVQMRNNYTVAGLTINVGAVLNDDGNDLSVTGNVVNNGTFGTNGGALIMRGTNATISGTGIFDDTDLQIDALGISLPAGSTMEFTNQAQVRVGRDNQGTFAINGSITGTGLASGDRILRVYQNSSVTIGGSINAPNAYIRIEQNASVTNNGTVTVQYLRTDAVTSTWTQGVNSSLTVSRSVPAGNWNGVLNASANGNTVTYNGTSTVLAPSAAGYWNLAGTIFPGACPIAYTVSGTNPCPAGSGSVISSPTSCTSLAGVGTVAWVNSGNAISSNNNHATAGLAGGIISNYLNCTGFNFAAIPLGATITGITVYVERKASRNQRIRDAFVYLIKGGTISTTLNGATATSYTTTDVVEAHGGATNLWGTTWTQAEVTAANFGVAFAARNYSAWPTVRTASVDHIFVKVDYSSATLHHVSISAPAAAMSLTEVPVNIAPHTTAHGTITAAGTINMTTSTGTGDWAIGSGTGTLMPGAANSGRASYTFGAGETSAILGFTSQSAGTVILNVASSGGADLLLNTPAGEKANTIVFSAPSFVFTGSACTHNVAFGIPGQCALVTWSPRTAGSSLANVYVTAVNTSGIPTRLHPTQARTRNMQFALSCHDPVANAGVQATFNATAVSLPLCAANGVTPTAWTAAVSLSFAGGSPSVGPYSFSYNDVGSVELWMRNSTVTTERGSSGKFVVKPADFVLSAIKCTAVNAASCGAGALPSGNNPAASNATGLTFIRAGDSFSVTITAVNSLGNATPNYGKEAVPENVKLATALVAPAGGNNPVLNGSFGAFTSGVATGTEFSWGEAGIITLTPSVGDGSYLGAGDVTGTISGNVGRFYPHHFNTEIVLSGGVPIPCQTGLTCPDNLLGEIGAVYSGQPFEVEVTAKNLAGVTTTNYDATLSFSKAVGLAAWDALGSTTTQNPNGALANTTIAAADFSSGVANTATPIYTLATATTAPTDIYLRATESAGDNVTSLRTLPSASIESGVKVVNGHIKIANAHGSELLILPMTATVEFYNGSSWLTSVTDNVSVLGLTASNYHRKSGGTWTVTPPASGVVTAGLLKFNLSSGGGTGSVDISATTPGYLLPSKLGRATFGVYKGGSELIYLRENY